MYMVRNHQDGYTYLNFFCFENIQKHHFFLVNLIGQ